MAFPLRSRQARRALLLSILSATLVLAGCQTARPGRPVGPGPGPGEIPEAARHRVAVLAPLSGPDGGVGTSIANAANLALLDSGDRTLRLTTYDTNVGAAAVAQRAIADGAELILGPLLAEDVRAVAPVARRAGVPVIAFSNDSDVAGRGVYVMGVAPSQSIERVVRFVRAKGATRFGGLVPTGLYGQRAAQALLDETSLAGARVVGLERFERSPEAARGAAVRLGHKGAMDAVLIADTGKLAGAAALPLPAGSRLLGTELWANDRALGQIARLRGAYYAAPPEARFVQLVGRYKARYGKVPYRIGSLGYDSVLLTVRAARGWPLGRPFPLAALADRDGFAGVDGIFRFNRDGTVQRALEVRQVTAAGFAVVSPSSASFGK